MFPLVRGLEAKHLLSCLEPLFSIIRRMRALPLLFQLCLVLPASGLKAEDIRELTPSPVPKLSCRFTAEPVAPGCLVRSGAVKIKGVRVYSAHGTTFPDSLNVYAIDLDSLPGKQAFRITRRSSDTKASISTFELFQADRRFEPARWPRTGFSREIKLGDDKTGVILPRDTYERFSKEPDLWLGAYWAADWAFETMPVLGRIDDQSKLVIGPLVSRRTIRPSFPFYVFNAFAALSEPGDYVFDEATRVVYAATVDGSDEFEIAVESNLLEIDGARDLHLSGLKLQKGLGTALIIRNSENVTIDNCDIRHMGGGGILVEGGKNVIISNCRIDDIAETAVDFKGGDRATLVPAGHVIRDSTITNFDMDTRTYHPGVRLAGVGIHVEGNRIQNSSHSGIILQGNDHVIRDNKLEDLVTEADDAGAIYVGRDWTERGTVIEDNIFLDIGMPVVAGSTSVTGRRYVSGIYLDDQESGYRIERNVFYNVSRPVFIHGGRDNILRDNAFLQCDQSGIYLNRRGEGLSGGTLEQRLDAVPYTSPVWAARYPALVNIRNEKPGEPINNVASGNVAVGCQLFAFSPKTSPAAWPGIATDSRSLPAGPSDDGPAAMLARAGLGCREFPVLCKP